MTETPPDPSTKGEQRDRVRGRAVVRGPQLPPGPPSLRGRPDMISADIAEAAAKAAATPAVGRAAPPDAPVASGPVAAAFHSLDPGLPLLLLPIRIDTNYQLDSDPPVLRIRILPDQVHVAADSAEPGTTETELTKQFWRQWYAANPRGQQAAWRRFTRRVGTERAGYLARLMRPRVAADQALRFPALGGLGGRTPSGPKLLPRHWIALGYRAGEVVFRRTSRPVRPDLQTGPDPAAPAWEADGSGLHVDEGLAWLVDYDRAVEVGMAITIEFQAGMPYQLDTLIVVGTMTDVDPSDLADQLDALLRAHARSSGLAFVPQGTPTNNTESVPSGWSRSGAEVADLAARELDPPARTPGSNADRFANALGLDEDLTLRRLAFGDDHERGRSRAMIRVTFEALLGTMMRRLLDLGERNGVPVAAANAARDWCIQHVTGGAHYPCLRIGPQPYGLLPVQKVRTAAEPATTADHIGQVVELLSGQWRQAAATLPVLNHNRGETDPADGATQTATVLASQPHPARLFVRRLDSYPDLDALSTILTPQWFYQNAVVGGIDPATNPLIESPYTEIGMLYRSAVADRSIDDIDAQIAVWGAVSAGLPSLLATFDHSDLLGEGLGWIDSVGSLLSAYAQRQHPVRDLNLAEFRGVLGEEATALIEGVMLSTSEPWGAIGLVEAPAAPAGQTCAEYLRDLKDRFARRDEEGSLPESGLGEDFLARQPLLYQLLDRSLHLAPRRDEEESAIGDALELLAGVPAADLEWLLRETLGLGMHRLDAWRTSLAAQRVDQLRRDNPTGIQVGAFGWVQDLKPRERPRRSSGFVHAPSLAQAATAAILRSGWQAHGSDDPLSPVTVDLRSARIRTASWLLDGVRAGQDLGDLLGYRFERSLHDRGADDQISVVRAAVRSDSPPDQPVDGIALLDLVRDGGLKNMTADVEAAVADIEGAFDAVNDAALAEAVHQLAAGNYGRATAMLDSMAGTHTPPELLGPRIPRDGVSVEHRVLILLDPAATADRGWAPGLRDRIAPALETWVASVLPRAGDVALPDGLSLADLRLSALDAIYLVGNDPSTLAGPLATLGADSNIGGRPGWSVGGSSITAAGTVPYSDFAVMAIELRRAIESLRVASARDLRQGHDPGDADLDLSAALAAASAVIAEFTAPDPRLLALVGVTAADAPRRLAAIQRADGVENQLAALLSARLPLLGTFGVPIDFSAGIAGPDEIDDWCDAMGRVRPALGRLFTAGMAAELAGGGGMGTAVAQTPSTGPWVATHRPDVAMGNLSLTAFTGPGGVPGVGAQSCGLVVDQWVERVPTGDQTTGVAVQHDAPSNRPPQAWLLAVTPEGEQWSLDLVLDTLLETLGHAAQRAVGPEDLTDYGRAIPSVFVPGNIVNWPAEGESS